MLGDLGDLEGSVLQADDCKDEDLAGWIAGAQAMLMPSFAEGFGLPIVEALGLGTPVIASDLTVFREIAGEIPTYLPPADENAWLEQIRAYLDDGPERQRQLSRIGEYRPPTWQQHFDIVENWLAAP